MVVKGTNNGNKRKIEDLTTTSSPTTSSSSLPKSLSIPSSTLSPPIPTKLSTIPRPRAQRKFAQGVVIPSPPVTSYKSKPAIPVKVKNVPVPQYSPPAKRPKTEDFLTFLCYRGTSALPKSLNFFNYPSHHDRVTDYVKVKSRTELNAWKESNSTISYVSQSSSHQRSQIRSPSLDLKPKSVQKLIPGKRKSSEELITKKSERDKLLKGKKTTLPPPLPQKPTHINEQDAKFAISALKLKYQEKRLANSKPSLSSVATKIAKKVKDRRVILTRSKAKDDAIEVSPIQNHQISKDTVRELSRRNAPSPDIIDGVKHKQQSRKDSSSSDSEDSGTDESSSSSSSSKSSSKEILPPTARSLRSGRKRLENCKKAQGRCKNIVLNRISTRASRRNNVSPLRELPMYGMRRKKKLKKGKGKPSPARRKEKGGKQGVESEKKSPEIGSSRRPSRKTKESAAFFLNLITKTFSSDENENGEKSEEEDSEGDTSASETKFLETRYKAIMKRDEQKGKNSKPLEGKPKRSVPSKSCSTTKKKTKAVKSLLPEKRILRSQSSREARERKNLASVGRVTRRRVTLPISPSDKAVHAGAARKSASVYPKKNRRSSSSSSGSTTNGTSSSHSSESSDFEEKFVEQSPPLKVKRSRRLIKPKASSITAKTSKPSEEDDGSQSESEETKKSGPRHRSFSTSVNESNFESPEHESERKNESLSSSGTSDSESDDSSSTEEERLVEKVEIAIQVDMDLEEEGNMLHQLEETPPPVLTPQINYISQGVQSDYTPPQPSLKQIPQSHSFTHQQEPSQIPITPSQHQIPIPHLPFPTQNFYPTLNNIEFISQQRTQQDFSVMLPTIGLPTVSTYSFGPPTVLTHNQLPTGIPIGYTSTSISAATTLQTHIRSVAANLDIPLVRPPVPTNLLSLPVARPPTGDPRRPLTRPVMNVWQDSARFGQQIATHYSAFRVPATTVLSGLPVTSSNYPHQYSNVLHPQYSHFRPTQSSAEVRTGQTGTSQRLQTSMHPGISAHGLSLIQSLPNVSIVPKFDRTVKNFVIRPEQQLSSFTTEQKHPTKGKTKEKDEPPKEKGRKRKVLPFTKAPSPLLVRKDSTNPITYVGKATKKSTKWEEHKQESVTSPSSEAANVSTVSFNQLIEQKQTKEENLDSSQSQLSWSKDKGPEKKEESQNLEDSKSDTKSKFYVSDVDSKMPKTYSKVSSCEASTDPESRRLKKDEKPKDSEKGLKSELSEAIVDDETPKSKAEALKSKIKKGTNSSRPASISSERSRSSRSESHDEKGEVKLENILAYYPTDEEFQDPLKYISQIQNEAEPFGVARIVPPKSFRPECNVEDDMRFTAYNHYVHRMHKRWGSNVHIRVGIMENLRKSKVRVTASNPPVIGGMEIDLTTLYQTVQSFGGLTEVIQKDKWNKVSDALHIPKAANDRASKLDAIYVKYVLPYEMLSESERKRLLYEVEKKWKLHERKHPESSDSESEEDPLLEVDDCVTKGKSTPLSSYYRVARNTMNMVFKNKEPSCNEVESAYWNIVRERDRHICVYSGSIDCAGLGWGFPLPKSGTSKHPWNLKVLANSPGSILKSMGPVMGATIPTLHVGMVFTTYCWYRDPHNLPWVEYLHSGGNKIWYVIPASHENNFRDILKEIMPRQCKDKKIWLTSDSAMVPPELLLSHGIPLFRAVQNPGEFLVVFPKAFTSAICTGYVISESVCFAPPQWLDSAITTFQDIRESKEPPVFPLEKLLLSILTDTRVLSDTLKLALPHAKRLLQEEISFRKKLRELGISTGKMSGFDQKSKKTKKKGDEDPPECGICNYVLCLSLVTHTSKKSIYCLPHALECLTKNKSRIKAFSLLVDQTDEQLRSTIDAAQSRLPN